MVTLGSFGMVIDKDGDVWQAAGVDAKTGLPKLTKTGIKAGRVPIVGANGTVVLADDLVLDQAKDAAEELRSVMPNAQFEIMPGSAVLQSPSITIMGVGSLSTASWYLVVRSKENPTQSGIAFNPLGVRVIAWLEKNKVTRYGDGSTLASIKTQLPALVPGLAAEIL